MRFLGTKGIFWISFYLSVAILQFVFGNFPFSFFKYPLNVIVGLLWVYVMWILYKDYNKNNMVRLVMSSSTTSVTILSLIAGSLVIGLFPQLSSVEAASKTVFLARLGVYDFMSSWIFVGVLFMLLTHLGMITIRAYFKRKVHRWRFILNHAGIWLAIWGGFMGSCDLQNLRIPVSYAEANNMAYTMEGERAYLDYDIILRGFEAEYYENGMPKDFEANVSIIKDEQEKEVVLKVNHPYQYSFEEDIYLTGYDMSKKSPEYCIIQIVRQPWKYVQLFGIVLALAGAVGMFVGGPYKVKEENDKLG